MEAETGVRGPEPRDAKVPGTDRIKEGSFPDPVQGTWPGQRSLSKSWPPEPREDKHCCRQLSNVWHFVTATTGNQHEDQMQSAHFAKCMTHRLRWPSVQSHLPRSRSFTREQTVVSGPATGHRASRLKPDHQGRFQSQPKCVRFYTFNMCHLLYFSRIVKKNNKKKDVQKGKNT